MHLFLESYQFRQQKYFDHSFVISYQPTEKKQQQQHHTIQMKDTLLIKTGHTDTLF